MQQSIVQKSYLGSVRIFWLNYLLILDRLKEKMSQVAILPEIREVWLFGSLSEMRAVPGSDLDILIIIEETELRFFDRIGRYQDLFSDIDIGVDLFPYTECESDVGLARQAKNKGVCIFSREDPDTTENAFNLLHSRLKKKYDKSSKNYANV